jgi:hypothetical protein
VRLALPLRPLRHREGIGEVIGCLHRDIGRGEVDCVLFGSTVEWRRVGGDVDLWIDGPDAAGVAQALRDGLERRGWYADVFSPPFPLTVAEFEGAVRCRVRETGVVVRGTLPRAPVSAPSDSDRPFREQARAAGLRAAWNADVFARAQLPSIAAPLAQEAVRCWLLSHTCDLADWRRVKRLGVDDLADAVRDVAPDLDRSVKECGWQSRRVTDAVVTWLWSASSGASDRRVGGR